MMRKAVLTITSSSSFASLGAPFGLRQLKVFGVSYRFLFAPPSLRETGIIGINNLKIRKID